MLSYMPMKYREQQRERESVLLYMHMRARGSLFILT